MVESLNEGNESRRDDAAGLNITLIRIRPATSQTGEGGGAAILHPNEPGLLALLPQPPFVESIGEISPHGDLGRHAGERAAKI
jgi:hypothetical protein